METTTETLRDNVLRFAVQNTVNGKHTTIGVTAWLSNMLDQTDRIINVFNALVHDGLLEVRTNEIFDLYYATDKATKGAIQQ